MFNLNTSVFKFVYLFIQRGQSHKNVQMYKNENLSEEMHEQLRRLDALPEDLG